MVSQRIFVMVEGLPLLVNFTRIALTARSPYGNQINPSFSSWTYDPEPSFLPNTKSSSEKTGILLLLMEEDEVFIVEMLLLPVMALWFVCWTAKQQHEGEISLKHTQRTGEERERQRHDAEGPTSAFG